MLHRMNSKPHDLRYILLGTVAVVVLIVIALTAHAEVPEGLALRGYVETYYQYNTNAPSNGITAFRGFDSRHNSFTISNVALDTELDHNNVVGRLTLQVGTTPTTYYLAEPSLPAGGGVSRTDGELWKYIQQSYVGFRSSGETAWLATAGVFVSPIGPEVIPVKDNYNWSRSNLFFGLPFYHTGARLTYPMGDKWSTTFAVFNGWNSVTDNNEEKSVCVHATYTVPSNISVNVLYFGGVERAVGAPEGRPWRNLFDAYVTWEATPRLTLLAHGDAGFEDNNFGTSSWVAGALYARFAARENLLLAGRVDVFDETVASNSAGSAGAIFWPVPRVASATATIDYRPQEHISFRAEYRHDNADGDMYFGDDVTGDGVTTPYLFNRSTQNTITLGAVAWF
jgi:hypothetical protein